MYYTVSVEARCHEVTAGGDLGDRTLTALEVMARAGRIAAPAVSENLQAKTIGTTLAVDHERDPVRAAEIGRNAFCEALGEVTGTDPAAIDVVEIVVIAELDPEESAARAD